MPDSTEFKGSPGTLVANLAEFPIFVFADAHLGGDPKYVAVVEATEVGFDEARANARLFVNAKRLLQALCDITPEHDLAPGPDDPADDHKSWILHVNCGAVRRAREVIREVLGDS